ncbi:MAG: exosortase/archaeosortase family protein [Paludibacter sp.]
MKIPKFKFPEKLEPFKGVILFAVVLMLSNFFWKYNVLGDEDTSGDNTVTFWGLDISVPFNLMAHHVARVCYSILHFFNSSVSLDRVKNIFYYSNGNRVQIVWACTGMKQAYICFCIMTFSRGTWIKKLWYVPLTLLTVYLINIFRITFIVATIENHPQWFDLLHLYVFKYAFYGIIFLMWVFWEENMVEKKK